MKKQSLMFLALVVLGLSSFVWFERGGEAPIEESLRKQYISLFEKVELPYKLEPNDNWMTATHLTRDYRHFISGLGRGQFSRMGPSDYYPEVMVASTDKFDAVIYSEAAPYDEKPTYYLQIVDKKGDVVDTRYLIEGYGESDFVNFNKDLTFMIHSPTTDVYLKIDADGKIIAAPAKAG